MTEAAIGEGQGMVVGVEVEEMEGEVLVGRENIPTIIRDPGLVMEVRWTKNRSTRRMLVYLS